MPPSTREDVILQLDRVDTALEAPEEATPSFAPRPPPSAQAPAPVVDRIPVPIRR